MTSDDTINIFFFSLVYCTYCNHLSQQGPAMEPFQHDLDREEHYADIVRMNMIDVIDDATVEAEMEAALKEYHQIGADLGINTNILQILA